MANTPVSKFWFGSEVSLKSKARIGGQGVRFHSETTLLGAVSVGSGQRDITKTRDAAGVYPCVSGCSRRTATIWAPRNTLLRRADSGKNDTQLDGSHRSGHDQGERQDTDSGHPIVLSLRRLIR